MFVGRTATHNGNGRVHRSRSPAARAPAPTVVEMCESLYQCSATTASRQAEIARTVGLGASEANALLHIEARDGATPGELADLLSITSGGVTALIRRLEHAGLAQRGPHPSDRRSSRVLITDEGATIARRLSAPIGRAVAAQSEHLGSEERAVIAGWLDGVGRRLAVEVGAHPPHDDDLGLAAPLPRSPFPNLWF